MKSVFLVIILFMAGCESGEMIFKGDKLSIGDEVSVDGVRDFSNQSFEFLNSKGVDTSKGELQLRDFLAHYKDGDKLVSCKMGSSQGYAIIRDNDVVDTFIYWGVSH